MSLNMEHDDTIGLIENIAESVDTEPVNTEPVNTEPVNTEPVNTEPDEQTATPPTKSVIETNLETCRLNMLENMNKFLIDDCYVYLMDFSYKNYMNKKAQGDSSFYIQNVTLTGEFAKRIGDIHTALGRFDASKRVADDYEQILKSCVNRINSENHGFTMAFNKKGGSYEILFVAKD